jgi:hypothetical protein
MDIKDAVGILNQSQGGHTYDVYVPSLVKTLNKFAMDDEDNFYKALSALIKDLSNNQVELNQINEIDRVLILSAIKKNNTTSPELIEVTCPECKEKYEHPLSIDNYDDDENLQKKIEKVELEYELPDKTAMSLVLGLPTVEEQIAFKMFIAKKKKARLIAERNKFSKGMSAEDKELALRKAQASEEIFYAKNSLFLFLRDLTIDDNNISGITSARINDRITLFDQLPGDLKGEIIEKVSKGYQKTLEHFMEYKVTCVHCEHEHVEEVSISHFFTI